ncbi:MAG: hypothetical protein H6728_13025 [Myxococcales bacterium]|nr:hypothetical protein [Myxococcales bacterium]MCB9643991.1 hypothetical protein [Myxococcales bacterium]
MLIATAFATFLDFLLKLFGPILGVLAGWYWGQWQASSAWKKKEFKTVLLLGLNQVEILDPETNEDGFAASLTLRTLFERKIDTIFANKAMLDLVHDGVEKTTEKDPIVRFPAEDGWFILNRILNEIAESFAVGTLKRDLKLPTNAKNYVFCITFERDGKMPQFKPRVLIIGKDELLNFPEQGAVRLESSKHEIRVQTIRQMKQEYKKNPHLFMEMEICL